LLQIRAELDGGATSFHPVASNHGGAALQNAGRLPAMPVNLLADTGSQVQR
jgi:hypothetical protein